MPQRIVRVWIDASRCDGTEACRIVPEVFTEGPSYFPVVPADAAQHLDRLRTDVIEAVMSCPTSALRLQYEDGRVVSSADYRREVGLQEWLEW